VLATLLAAAYGVAPDGRRHVPSAGALYPLELYTVATDADGIDTGTYHYDPYVHRLERFRDNADLRPAIADGDLFDRTCCAVVLTAVFWRSRFKYGQRAYRFTLLESGHVAQNLLLAASALDVAALPLGGFYDARLDELLGLDGVDESSLYVVLLGGRT
jgi:SagB-type dehydrogenase family enzyme